ncbi:copper resistance CopC family protein [Rhizobium sp. 21-4511-3d]
MSTLIRMTTLAAAVFFVGAASAGSPPEEVGRVVSIPRNGEVVERAPAEIEMRFSTRLRLRGHLIRIFDADRRVRASGQPVATKEFTRLHMPVFGYLQQGRYTVEWSAATAGGEALAGSFTFVVRTTAGR